MTGYKDNLTNMVEKESHLRVVLGDDARYTVKGSRATSLQVDSSDTLHLSNALYVPRMKMNLLYISSLEEKGCKVAFSYGKVLAWIKNSSMDLACMIDV